MISLILFSLLNTAQAAAPAQVQNLAGCFAVSYRFVEDGSHDKEIAGTFEQIDFEEKTDGSFYLQHWGVDAGMKNKHFAEQWTPQADGKWKQVILSPFGTFRYECLAPFVFNQYTCSVKNAPKPNRDRNRTDYETLDREIWIQSTPAGWTQMENNIKRDKNNGFVSNELGWIEYRRTEKANCLQ
jgi:hypothetical protein